MRGNTSDQIKIGPNWRVSDSERDGYIYNYFLETFLSPGKGTTVNVDFNPVRNMVRIQLNSAAEANKEYVAIVKSGNVLQERENISREPLNLTSRISPLSKHFCQLEETGILHVINGNFQLPKSSILYKKELLYKKNFFIKKQSIRQFIKNHLAARRHAESQARGFVQKLLRRLPNETFDGGIGALFFLAFSQGYLSFSQLALAFGFFGISSGAVDIFWRQRSPFIPKVAFFVGCSAAMVYTQVQYRMWAIYL